MNRCFSSSNFTTMQKILMSFTKYLLLATYLMFRADGRSLGNGGIPFQAYNYIVGSIIDVPMDIWNPPRNKNNSVGYRVYTQEHPKQPCFLEPTLEALKNCPIDPDNPLILLVHGFIEGLAPGTLYEVMKDKILANGPYTVIILDWTKYDGPPVSLALYNMYKIGPLGAEMLNFLVKYAGVKAENMRITGHSLGAHLAGYIARLVKNIGMVDCLDPAGLFFSTPPFLSKVSHTDAKFVRVIHTSNELTGLGITEALGDMDFYVNGGKWQPHCSFFSKYTRTSGDYVTVNSLFLKQICPHEMAILYYINGINTTDCRFMATQCDNSQDFYDGKCDNNTMADMGFNGKKIDGLPPKTKFYLKTGTDIPFCLSDDFQPKSE